MLKFDELEIGDEIAVDIKREITQDRIDKWAEVSVDFNPLHVDKEFGKKSRFGSTISHGTLTITYLMEMLTSWMGKGWLYGGRLLNVKFIAPVLPGDTVHPAGKILNKRIEKDRKVIECELWLENQDGKKVITSKAIGEAE